MMPRTPLHSAPRRLALRCEAGALAALILSALLALAGCSTSGGSSADRSATPLGGAIPSADRPAETNPEAEAETEAERDAEAEARPAAADTMRRRVQPPTIIRAERPLPEAPVPADGFVRAVENGTRTLDGRPGDAYWTNTARYDLTARLFPNARRLEGSGTITYVNRSPDVLGRLFLELAQNLHAEGVTRNEPAEITGGIDVGHVAVNGTPLGTEGDGPRYVVEGTTLAVLLPAPLAPGDSVRLALDWAFDLPQAGAGARMGYAPADDPNLFFLAYWYPQMAVYDDVTGWMTDAFLGRAEFYADHADYRLAIEAPAGWVVQGTGALQNAADVLAPDAKARYDEATRSDAPVMILTPEQPGTASGAERLTWRFEARNVRDVAFSATRGAHWEAARTPVGDRDGDGQTNYAQIHTVWRETAPLWSEVTRYQQHAITFLSEQTGLPYPWPHMTAVEGGGIIGGGMEFPMMTLMGDYNGRSASALYAVTAHELAHMWVPMIVSTNERRYSWMDEGTTSFNENDARVAFYDGDSDAIALDRADYVRVARQGREGPMMRWSNFHYDGLAFVIASYRKPATLLVALRGLLGDATFTEAYHGFLRDWAYKHPYPQDFFHAFERAANRDLSWFWHSFYYETWTLDQALAAVEQRGGTLVVTVEDEGKAFMPARLTVTLADGSTVEHEVPVDVWLSGRTRVTTQITVTGRVDRVELDAARVFPDIDRSDNVWTRTGGTSR
jgi:hypothetical protein